ncbi:ribokinase [Metarhizium rileyi]|uniref:Ribokinase n=1 Tax=Metarhizium rileyi (strain RCEF 4871) TaxID=1649241 RepID=A0A167HB96_METRR|nr:ribokinase [Metarhizium rileyi RCEF 4871]TWU76528.1 hypothetical protein ED733_007679 [Metarhizium rileyi]
MSELLTFPDAAAASLKPHLPPADMQASKRPFVTLTFATSLDSSLALTPGVQTHLSGPGSKAMTHFLRSRHAAILVGVSTVLADNPGLSCRIEGSTSQPRPIIIDPHLRWTPRATDKVLENCRSGTGLAPFILTGLEGTQVPKESAELIQRHGGKYLHVRSATPDKDRIRFDWNDVFQALLSEHLTSVMVEGGGQIINSLLNPSYHDLIDAVIVTIAPTWLGKGGVVVSPDRVCDAAGTPQAAARLSNVSWHPFGEDVVLCGKLASQFNPGAMHLSYVPHHPQPGETLTATHFNTSPGGKGANQAVACGKLSRASDLSSPSADVAMVGAVGADEHGTRLLDSLASYGVDTSAVAVREDGRTGVAIVVVDEPSGQNRIILSPESNYSLLPGHFEEMPAPRPDLLIMQLEVPLDTVVQAVETARGEGVPVLLNPAPAQTLPARVYHGLEHLVVNETEASILSGRPESELEDRTGLDAVASVFLHRGVHNVVITLGGRGVFYATRGGKKELVPALKAHVVDTTAAGDTFVGSYALSVVGAGDGDGEFDIDAAIRAANRASAITVSRKGAQMSIPWKDELQ